VLNRSDLRKVDFTGAKLNYARLERAKLQIARFGCADVVDVVKADSCTSLQGAILDQAQMQGAYLRRTLLQGASLDGAKLQGADLQGAHLEGASLFEVQLQEAKLDGANLNDAQLTGAWLSQANLRGATLDGAQLQGAILIQAYLEGAMLENAELQGASFAKARLTGASLSFARVWRARGDPNIDLVDFGLDLHRKPWEDHGTTSTFAIWRDSILKLIPTENHHDMASDRLATLNPARNNEPNDVITEEFWNKAASKPPQGKQRQEELGKFLGELACSSDSPYVARGLLKFARMTYFGSPISIFAEIVRVGKSNQAACRGVEGFTDEDWATLDSLVNAASNPQNPHPLEELEDVFGR
jgi:uncharacterized protein YjbI with pentapeptide repeats